MRINRGYRAARAAGKSTRMAGQEVLKNTQGVGAYIRDKGQLAVQHLDRIDQAYAKKVGELIGPENPLGMGSAVPLRDFAPSNGTADTLQEKILLHAGKGALATANVASRYALPAGGAVLAAKGIADIATGTAFGGPADQQEQGQLSLY